jgi:hypothetical protein
MAIYYRTSNLIVTQISESIQNCSRNYAKISNQYKYTLSIYHSLGSSSVLNNLKNRYQNFRKLFFTQWKRES